MLIYICTQFFWTPFSVGVESGAMALHHPARERFTAVITPLSRCQGRLSWDPI